MRSFSVSVIGLRVSVIGGRLVSFDRSSYVKHVRSFSVSVIGLRVSVIEGRLVSFDRYS